MNLRKYEDEYVRLTDKDGMIFDSLVPSYILFHRISEPFDIWRQIYFTSPTCRYVLTAFSFVLISCGHGNQFSKHERIDITFLLQSGQTTGQRVQFVQ